jgi:hypothetical protein
MRCSAGRARIKKSNPSNRASGSSTMFAALWSFYMIDALRDLVRRVDFKPLRIFTNGGPRYDITHPDNLAFGKSELFYYFPKSDRSVHIPYRNIASVEEVAQKSSK